MRLKEGGEVAGIYGGQSFASSLSSDRDLLIQEIYKIDGDGNWKPIPRRPSILIRGEQIKSIEFWTNEEDEHVEQVDDGSEREERVPAPVE